MKTPAQSQPAPSATSAPSRCFTSVSVPLRAHGKRAVGQLSSLGFFQIAVVLSGNRSYFTGTVRWPHTESHCPRAYGFTLRTGERGSCVLSWEIRQSRPTRNGYKILGHKSQELFNSHCPLTETGAFSAKKEVLKAFKTETFLGRTTGQQERQTCCFNSWSRGRTRGRTEAPSEAPNSEAQSEKTTTSSPPPHPVGVQEPVHLYRRCRF